MSSNPLVTSTSSHSYGGTLQTPTGRVFLGRARQVRAITADYVALTKPRITTLVIATAATGYVLAPGPLDLGRMFSVLLAVGLVVSSANALNCWLERDIDRYMERTRLRPLPAGRISARIALGWGLLLGTTSIPLLFVAGNTATGVMGALALFLYVAVYTPLKSRTPYALHVGAIPGALPPLMGWTAATGTVSTPGLILFGILFFWQIPHFIAISLFRSTEYARASLRVLPLVVGVKRAKIHAMGCTMIVACIAVLPSIYGWANGYYTSAAVTLGALFFGSSLYGLRADAGPRWARSFFAVSLVYLTFLLIALVAAVRG